MQIPPHPGQRIDYGKNFTRRFNVGFIIRCIKPVRDYPKLFAFPFELHVVERVYLYRVLDPIGGDARVPNRCAH